MTFADHLHACSIESVHREINEQIVFPFSNGLPRGSSVCPSELFRHDEYRGMIRKEEELMQWMMSVPLFYPCREAWRWSEKEMTSLHQLCSSRRIRDACRSTIATRTSVGWHDVVLHTRARQGREKMTGRRRIIYQGEISRRMSAFFTANEVDGNWISPSRRKRGGHYENIDLSLILEMRMVRSKDRLLNVCTMSTALHFLGHTWWIELMMMSLHCTMAE